MQFLVVFDDQGSLCIPMGKDSECEGAICIASPKVALFNSRAAAKRAIKISRLFAELRKAQGMPANEDFLNGYKNIRLISAESSESYSPKIIHTSRAHGQTTSITGRRQRIFDFETPTTAAPCASHGSALLVFSSNALH